MKITGEKMVVTINADTGEVERVTDGKGKVLEPLKKKGGEREAEKGEEEKELNMKVGKLVRLAAYSGLVYDDSEDCFIFYNGHGGYYRVGC